MTNKNYNIYFNWEEENDKYSNGLLIEIRILENHINDIIVNGK